MRLLEFPIIKFVLALCLGILCSYIFHLKIAYGLAFLGLGLIISLLFLIFPKTFRANIMYGLVTYSCFLGLGMSLTSLQNPEYQRTHYQHKVVSEKAEIVLKIKRVLGSNKFHHRYYANVFLWNGESTTGNILLEQSLTDSVFQVEDKVFIWDSIRSLKPALNPHQFNYKAYLNRQGVFGRIRLRTSNYVGRSAKEFRKLPGWAARVRGRIIKSLKKKGFNNEALGIFKAILLGERTNIDPEIYNNYKNAGVVHILAISGLHIGIILMLLQWLFSPLTNLKHGDKLQLLLTLICLWSYAVLAGFSPSVVRAVSMFSFVAYAWILNRPTNIYNTLALSMFFVLLFKPLWLLEVGFQMSYAAVFSIAALFKHLQNLWNPKFWIFRKVRDILGVSIAAQIGVLPISLFYFHQFPSLFFITNLIILPFLGAILCLGFVVGIAAYFQVFSNILLNFFESTLLWMNRIIAWIASWEQFVLTDISFGWRWLFISYLGIIFISLYLIKSTYRSLKNLLVVVVVCLGLLLWRRHHFLNNEKLLIPHQYKKTMVLHQMGNQLQIFSNDSLDFNGALFNNYKMQENLKTLEKHSLQNIYLLKDKYLMILNNETYKNLPAISVEWLLLSNSPFVNLDRILETINPKIVIADGSNFPSMVDVWKQTCAKRKLPFHYTGEKGAYYLKFSED